MVRISGRLLVESDEETDESLKSPPREDARASVRPAPRSAGAALRTSTKGSRRSPPPQALPTEDDEDMEVSDEEELLEEKHGAVDDVDFDRENRPSAADRSLRDSSRGPLKAHTSAYRTPFAVDDVPDVMDETEESPRYTATAATGAAAQHQQQRGSYEDHDEEDAEEGDEEVDDQPMQVEDDYVDDERFSDAGTAPRANVTATSVPASARLPDPNLLQRQLGLNAMKLHLVHETLLGRPSGDVNMGDNGDRFVGELVERPLLPTEEDDYYPSHAAAESSELMDFGESPVPRAPGIASAITDTRFRSAFTDAGTPFTERHGVPKLPAPFASPSTLISPAPPPRRSYTAGAARDADVAGAVAAGERFNPQRMSSMLPTDTLENIGTGAIAMRHSFRVGWGPDGLLVHAQAPTTSTVVLKRVRLDPPQDVSGADYSRYVQSLLTEHRNHYAAGSSPSDVGPSRFGSKMEVEDEKGSGSDTSLTVISQLCNRYINTLENELTSGGSASHRPSVEQQWSLWKLVKALWAPELGAPLGSEHMLADRERIPFQDTREDRFARLTALKHWARDVVSREVDREIRDASVASRAQSAEDIAAGRALSLLSGFRVNEGVEELFKCRDFRLATIACQLGEDYHTRLLMHEQIKSWHASHVLPLIDSTHRKLYGLLGGNLQFTKPFVVSWVRAFGQYLWFGLETANTSIPRAVECYDRDWSAKSQYSPPPPLPPYSFGGPHREAQLLDARYSLIRLYYDRSLPQHHLYAPEAFTKSLIDYTTGWLLHDVVAYTTCEDYRRIHYLYTSFMAQLQLMNLWHWAVYVVFHSERFDRILQYGAEGRRRLMLEIIARHCPRTVMSGFDRGICPTDFSYRLSSGSTDVTTDWERVQTAPQDLETLRTESIEQNLAARDKHNQADFGSREQFLRAIGVPAALIAEAKALRAKYDRAPYAELKYLLEAGQIDRAHAVFLSELAAPWILQPASYQEMSNVLVQIREGDAGRRLDWRQKGGLYLNYLECISLCDQLEADIARSEVIQSVSQHRITDLQQRIRDVVNDVKLRPADNLLQRVVTSQMTAELAIRTAKLQAFRTPAADSDRATARVRMTSAMTENHRLEHLIARCSEILGAPSVRSLAPPLPSSSSEMEV